MLPVGETDPDIEPGDPADEEGGHVVAAVTRGGLANTLAVRAAAVLVDDTGAS